MLTPYPECDRVLHATSPPKRVLARCPTRSQRALLSATRCGFGVQLPYPPHISELLGGRSDQRLCSRFLVIRVAWVVFTGSFAVVGFDRLRVLNISQLLQPSQNLSSLFGLFPSGATTALSYRCEQSS